MMTSCPKKVQLMPVSTGIRPVTQVAEVAVKRLFKKPALSPLFEAKGSMSKSVPSRMMAAKPPATIRVAFMLFFLIRTSLSQRLMRFITEETSKINWQWRIDN